MKKIFATLALFASLAITACGNQASSENHVHKYGDWEVVTPATCAQEGEEKQTCSCGDVKTRKISKIAHTWGELTPVTGAEDEVDYSTAVCTVCGAKKIEFAAVQEGKYTLDGTLKKDSTYPTYMKLDANNQSISYKFNYAGEAATNAVIYFRGVMDYWHDGNNENQDKNFFSGKNSQDGNFELKVNDAVVDYSDTKSLTYADMFPGDYTGTYSPLGEAKVGACKVNQGANTVVFKRTESYNVLVKDFVIVIGQVNHYNK